MGQTWAREAPGAWLLASAAALAVGCSSGTGPSGATANNNLGTASASTADGGANEPLLCAPSARQVDACSGQAAGAACSLDGRQDAGWSIPGTCRTTLDGSDVACVPSFDRFASARANACTGKASGDACQVSGQSGWGFEGVCVAPRSGLGLVCGHPRTPPPPAAAACNGLAAGDACVPMAKDWRDGGPVSGVCTNGPADAGPLACSPERKQHGSPLAAACTGLDAGSSCSLGHWGKEASGSCESAPDGGAVLCIVPCSDLGRHFHRHHWGGWGGGWPGPGKWHPDGGMPMP
jgi:hypothetical protein